jgi:uncharacterized protein
MVWPTSDDWDWRVSVAEIEHDGPFSTLTGVYRTIALILGNGFRLTVGEQPAVTVETSYTPLDFSGDESTVCALSDGRVQEFNVMVRRTCTRPRAQILDVVDVDLDEIELGEIKLVIVVAGDLRFGSNTRSRLDAIRREPGTGSMTRFEEDD